MMNPKPGNTWSTHLFCSLIFLFLIRAIFFIRRILFLQRNVYKLGRLENPKKKSYELFRKLQYTSECSYFSITTGL